MPTGLAGYMLARVLEGEFGRSAPGLRLEVVGVRDDARGHGVGPALFDALADWARRHGMRDLRTRPRGTTTGCCAGSTRWASRWRRTTSSTAPWAAASTRRSATTRWHLPGADGRAHEIDYGAPEANDFERLARDIADVRAMPPDDLPTSCASTARITGRDRARYMPHKLDEAMDDSAIRVSLTARLTARSSAT